MTAKARPRGRPATPTSALVPAASRGATAVADIEAVLNSEAIEVFAKAVGGREQLADTLAVAGTGSIVEKITSLLLDPRYQQWSLARLCQTAGITVADLFASYRKALIARAHIESSHIIARKLPPIVDDVMTRAAPQIQRCPSCQGASSAPAAPCGVCNSTGWIQTEPELDRQKLALELGQLLEKKGGIVVQQNNMAATLGATAPGSLEQLQQAVGDLLFGGRAAAEADVIDAEAHAAAAPRVPADDPDGEDDEDDEEEPELPFEQPDSPPSPRRPERSEPPGAGAPPSDLPYGQQS